MSGGSSVGAAPADGHLRKDRKAPAEDGATLLLIQAIRDLEGAIERTALQIGNAARMASQTERALTAIAAQAPAGRQTSENMDWSVRMIAEANTHLRQMAFAGPGSGAMHRGGRHGAAPASNVRALSDMMHKATSGLYGYIARLQGEVHRCASIVEQVTPLLNELRPVFSALQAAAEERDARLARISETLTKLSGRAESRAAEPPRTAAGTSTRPTHGASADVEPKGAERRRHVRHNVKVPVVIQWAGTAHVCHSVDVSEGGMLVSASEKFPVPVGTTVQAKSDHLGSFSAKIVGKSRRGVHLEFVLPDAR